MDIGAILFFAVFTAGVFLAGFWLFAVTACWSKVAAAFPLRTYGAVFGTYKNAISQVGRIEFEGQGRGTVKLTDQGFHLHMANPFMADALVPFSAVARAREISVLGQSRVTIEIAHEANLSLSLPREALQILAARVDSERLEEGVALDSIPEIYRFAQETLAAHFRSGR